MNQHFHPYNVLEGLKLMYSRFCFYENGLNFQCAVYVVQKTFTNNSLHIYCSLVKCKQLSINPHRIIYT